MAKLLFELAFFLMSAIVSVNTIHGYDYAEWNLTDEISEIQLDCQPCICETDYYFKCETKDTIEQIPNIAPSDSYRENNFQSM